MDDLFFNLAKIHKKKSHYDHLKILIQNYDKTDLFDQNYKYKMLVVFKNLKLSLVKEFNFLYYKFVFACKNKTNLNFFPLYYTTFQQ